MKYKKIGTVAETQEYMKSLRREGKTQREIAELTGYSLSRVAQLTNEHDSVRFVVHRTNGCIYTGLRRWLNENKISIWELVERMGYSYSGCTASRIRGAMSGKRDMRKSEIDAFMRLSGKSYEELFGEVG